VSGDRKPLPFLTTAADETFGQFSPDGKWVAYSSDESGRREVYVQGFAPDRVPAAGPGKWVISNAGDDKPRWARDGKKVYCIGLEGTLMEVPVKLGPPFEPGTAVPLFQTRVTGFLPYDVSPDGRFLINTVKDSGRQASPITVVLNWQEELKRLVPTRSHQLAKRNESLGHRCDNGRGASGEIDSPVEKLKPMNWLIRNVSRGANKWS
jgi:hypothetical protein